jgi:hypothetical protein
MLDTFPDWPGTGGGASVVVSIFVNPTQFSPQEDLAAYPRPPSDLQLLKSKGLTWVDTHPGNHVSSWLPDLDYG